MVVQGELVGRRREQRTLSGLVDGARRGSSGVLVIWGEPGIGKTALATNTLSQAPEMRHIQISGTEYESELAYAGLHQLCAPLLGHLGRLPAPQQNALRVAFGLSEGPAPDRFRIGLAVLTLLSESASEQPILCVVDDAQWMDSASLQTLAFVARRLSADAVVMIFASRLPGGGGALTSLPDMPLRGLDEYSARELLTRYLPGRLEKDVSNGIVAEAAGNPLALLELHRVLTPTELAGGFGLAGARHPVQRVESVFGSVLPELPESTQTLLLIAASEPSGEPSLLWAAAEHLGVGIEAAEPAEQAGLIRIGRHVRFRHPLVRSAVYQRAAPSHRRHVHRALADVMVSRGDEAHRAWHRAHATAAPDERVAAELEASAEQARARGGVAAAAAFLRAATELTPDASQRRRRALAAARDTLDSGAPETAMELLADAEPDATEIDRVHVELLRAEVVFATRRGGDAPLQLSACAERLAPLDENLSRLTYLKAVMASVFSGRFSDGAAADPRTVARAARAAPRADGTERVVDLMLDGLIERFTGTYESAAPLLSAALQAFGDDAARGTADPQWYGLAGRIALDLWDQRAWAELAARQIETLRSSGVLTLLPVALAHRAGVEVHAGRFAEAAGFIEEAQAITTAIGVPAPGYIEPVLAAFRGQHERTLELVRHSIDSANERREGRVVPLVQYAAAVLHNTFGEYREALAATGQAVQHDDLGMYNYALIERVEAAAGCGEMAIAREAADQLVERAKASPTDMALGMAARSQALVATGAEADRWYREAIDHLGGCDVDVLLARVYLLYGEWLHRESRHDESNVQLRQAHSIFSAAAAHGFADRARKLLTAQGDAISAPQPGLSSLLSRQELAIARLARRGHSNSEIAAQLFISPRTVEWHLTKIFGKLGITSRRGLRTALADIE